MERDKTKYPDSSEIMSIENNTRMWVGPLVVTKSAAGWFIGRMCWVECDGMAYEDHYSRESGYYPTEEAAQAELDSDSFVVRDCVENNDAYEQGILPRPKR